MRLRSWVLAAVFIAPAACTGQDRASPPTPVPTTAVPSPAPATSPATPAPVAVELLTHGLGVAKFGEAPEIVVPALSRQLGEPDEDTGVIDDPQSPFGVCAGGAKLRGVRWSGLWVLFTQGETFYASAGKMHFFTYFDSAQTARDKRSKPSRLTTRQRIGVGGTVQRLRVAYRDKLELTEDEIVGPRWHVRGPEGAFLGGSLTSRSDRGTVTSVEGGQICGE